MHTLSFTQPCKLVYYCVYFCQKISFLTFFFLSIFFLIEFHANQTLWGGKNLPTQTEWGNEGE